MVPHVMVVPCGLPVAMPIADVHNGGGALQALQQGEFRVAASISDTAVQDVEAASQQVEARMMRAPYAFDDRLGFSSPQNNLGALQNETSSDSQIAEEYTTVMMRNIPNNYTRDH